MSPCFSPYSWWWICRAVPVSTVELSTDKQGRAFLGCTPRGSCNNTLLRGLLEGPLMDVFLRRVLRGHRVRVSAGTGVLTGVLRRGGGS